MVDMEISGQRELINHVIWFLLFYIIQFTDFSVLLGISLMAEFQVSFQFLYTE